MKQRNFFSTHYLIFYWDILRKNGKTEWDIEAYLEKHLSIGEGVTPEEELLYDFEQWKEQTTWQSKKYRTLIIIHNYDERIPPSRSPNETPVPTSGH